MPAKVAVAILEDFCDVEASIGAWARTAIVDDIAGAVLLLLSLLAAFVHGHTLMVDGGWTGYSSIPPESPCLSHHREQFCCACAPTALPACLPNRTARYLSTAPPNRRRLFRASAWWPRWSNERWSQQWTSAHVSSGKPATTFSPHRVPQTTLLDRRARRLDTGPIRRCAARCCLRRASHPPAA